MENEIKLKSRYDWKDIPTSREVRELVVNEWESQKLAVYNHILINLKKRIENKEYLLNDSIIFEISYEFNKRFIDEVLNDLSKNKGYSSYIEETDKEYIIHIGWN